MITAFDPKNTVDFVLPEDDRENPTTFKLRGLSGREFIRYKGLVKVEALEDVPDFETELDPDSELTDQQKEVISSRVKAINKYYADNIEANDFLLEKGLVGWDNFSVVFDDATKIDCLTEQQYIALSSEIVNLSQIQEDTAKK